MCFGQLLSNRKILILCLNGNSHRKKTLFDFKISNDLFDGTFLVKNEPMKTWQNGCIFLNL